jgi:hypothetical protein
VQKIAVEGDQVAGVCRWFVGGNERIVPTTNVTG